MTNPDYWRQRAELSIRRASAILRIPADLDATTSDAEIRKLHREIWAKVRTG